MNYIRDIMLSDEAPTRSNFDEPRPLTAEDIEAARLVAAGQLVSSEPSCGSPANTANTGDAPAPNERIEHKTVEDGPSTDELEETSYNMVAAWLAELLGEQMEDEHTLLEDIQRRHAVVIERIARAAARAIELDSKAQDELIIELIVDEYLPEAYQRRAIAEELSRTALHPEMLLEEYDKAETEDVEDFIASVFQEVREYLMHAEDVEALSEQSTFSSESWGSILSRLQETLSRVCAALKAYLAG